MEGLASLMIVMAFVAVYFLPTIVAYVREHHNQMPIFVLNLVLGWTFLAWFIALIWALTAINPALARR